MKRETICLIIACLISFILTAGIMNWRMEIVHAELSDTQQSLAKEVFRFHVIAESDSANDQRIKLKVRDAVLKYMKAHMTRAERSDAKATKAWTLTHKKELTDTADKILKKEKVSIIELAPMTNLARLIQKDKEAFSCIEEIVSMGGSFKSHGNCSPVAEYNYWCDPDGASLVYETLHQNGQKIHMVGLDVTRKIVLTPDLLEYMCRLNKETGEFVKKITKFYFDFHWEWEHIIGCVINDPLAVAYFLDPDICQGFDSYVQIETEGISLGQSVVDSMDFYRKTPNTKVLTEVDVYAFFQLFLSRILGLEPEKLDILQDLIRGDLK